MSQSLSNLQEEIFSAMQGNFSHEILEQIEPISQLSSEACLQIYSRGYLARLTESLGDTFEATWWVLGDEDFFQITRDYILNHRSNYFDLSDYGEGFPDFLLRTTQANEIPFLVDLAKFEWLFKKTFHSANIGPVDPSFYNQITEDTSLAASDSATLFSSSYSIYELWQLRSQPIELAYELNMNSPNFLLIYKKESQIYIKNLDSKQWVLLNQLFQGETIEKSLQSLVTEFPGLTPIQVQEVFSQVATLGIFVDKK